MRRPAVFSNILQQDFLRQLAEADEHCAVKSVQEFYADYYAVNADFFSLNLGQSLSLSGPRASWPSVTSRIFDRSVQGLLSALLSMKVRPFLRYSANSEVATLFTRKVQSEIKNWYELFDFRRSEGQRAVLLVLDRRDDPVTPLLMQWTYQAMVHELMGLRNNRVDMSKVPGIKPELKEVVLSAEQDTFFAANMYANMGDLGEAVKELLESYQSERSTHENIASVADMERFVERYPELRKRSTAVGKHVATMGQLVRLVDERALMEVSGTEQNVACSDGSSAQFREISEHIANPAVTKVDALKLVMLYALRYETARSSHLDDLKAALVREKGLSGEQLRWIDALLQYGGAAVRSGDLFGNKGILSKVARSVKRGVVGVANVFTQHEPLVSSLLEQLARGKLSKTAFPYQGPELSGPATNVIVFILGGATYEEAAKVAAFNAAGVGPHVILGGTFVHNSRTFLDELAILGSSSFGGAAGAAGGAGGAAGRRR